MPSSALIINEFHRLFHGSGQWVENTKWLGVPAQKCPLDLWVYQEIIYELQPDVIIETGTCFGGSALFMASVCDMIGHGQVFTVDLHARECREHNRITYLLGSSIEPAILASIRALSRDAKTILVILDSDHSMNYVLKEMRAYAPFVTKGSYLIVEDTDVNGHPIMPEHGPGPAEAVEEFLKTNREFEADREREKFLMTQNPNGYLRRKS